MATTSEPISPHTEAVRALLDKMRALRADVPRFVPAAPKETRKILQKSLVPDDVLEATSVLIQTFARLEQVSGTDAATLRDAYSYALAYDAIVKEAFAFARSVAHTIRVQRAEAGASALDIYAIAQRMSAQKDGAELLPHVQDIKNKLARLKRPRKTTSNPAPAPIVEPAPAPSGKV